MPEINNFYYIWYQWNYANLNETKNHIEKSLDLIFGAHKVPIFTNKDKDIAQEKTVNAIRRPVNSEEIKALKSSNNMSRLKSTYK